MADPFAKQTPAAKLLLTGPEAAAALSVTVRTLFELRRAGRIPSVRLTPNGRPLYAVKDLEEFIQVNRQIAEAAANAK